MTPYLLIVIVLGFRPKFTNSNIFSMAEFDTQEACEKARGDLAIMRDPRLNQQYRKAICVEK
jgi:hypothetical protein